MKKYLILAVLSLTTVAVAGDKKYEDGKLVDIQMVSAVTTDTWVGANHNTHSVDKPRFVVQVGDMQYTGDCVFGSLTNRYHATDYTVGDSVGVRFNDKRSEFRVKKTNGKDSPPCSVVKQSKVQ